MATTPSNRGDELLHSPLGSTGGPSWLARLWSGKAEALIERIDRGLARGVIHATLPDGSHRTLGGRAPGFEVTVELRRWRGLLRVATAGSVGLYQGWEAQDWVSADPVSLFALFMDNADALGDTARAHGPWRWVGRLVHALRRNSRAGSRRNIHAHYDLGNDFYAAWLGSTMAYSSGIFDALPAPDDGQQRLDALDQAQLGKITEVVKRAAVPQGGSVLEIGCGWGAQSFALSHGAGQVVGISLSERQLAFCRARQEGSAAPIEFRYQDYRDVTGQFDAVVSVEMVEAVGRAYWPDFFDCLHRCLKPGGRAVVQYITIRDDLFDAYAASADFIQTYIFPGGMLIRESEFRTLAAARGLEWTDPSAFGLHYAETLLLWRERFDLAVAEGRLPSGFDVRFVRLWRFYLMYCEGGFRGGGIDVRQVTLIKLA